MEVCTSSNWEDVDNRLQKIITTPTPTFTPVPTPIVVPTAVPKVQMTISELDNILLSFNKKGWQQLYERNSFDCTRMSSYWQIILGREYGINSEILESDSLVHAWLAVRASDFKGSDTNYGKWTDSDGIKWYYIEATVPKVLRYETANYWANDEVTKKQSNIIVENMN